MEIIVLIVTGVLVFMLSASILNFIKFSQVLDKMKKYPQIYRNFLNRNKIAFLPFGPPTFLGFYSRNEFNRIFDKKYLYDDIKKTGDLKLLRFLNYYRRFNMFYLTSIRLIFALIALVFLVVFLIFIIALMGGGVN